MPIPSLSGLQLALSGLDADQLGLDTTGNNIDNASTPGYSEEIVNTATSTPQLIPADSPAGWTQLGTGVDVLSITRQRNSFLDTQYRAQNTVLGYYTQNATDLGNAQSMFGEPSNTAISGQLSTFWSDWNGVANNPTGLSAQQTLVDGASQLTASINTLYNNLAQVQSQAQSQYSSLTGSGGQLEQYANQIASLNGQIKIAVAAGQSPNTLEDARDTALDNLSQLGNVSVTNNNDGTVTVGFGDAANPLVSGTSVDWPQTITAATGGQIGALLNDSSANGQIGKYMSSLNTFASDLINQVNTSSPGFFSGTNASNIAVAASPGSVNTANALAVANIQGSTSDPTNTYDAIVTQVGDDVNGAQANQSNSQAIVTALQNQRESVSGVSIDQEMTNLIAYQRGYQASAQTLNALNGMLQTLISQV
jgi:flagellar hook-associated protein 1 FlgK